MSVDDDLERRDEPPEDIVQLASRFGIGDARLLEEALGEASDAAMLAGFRDGVLSQIPPDDPDDDEEDLPLDDAAGMSSGREVAQHARLVKLVCALRDELCTPENSSAMTLGATAHFLKQALERYAGWLDKVQFIVPAAKHGAPTDVTTKAFVTALARHWPELTGASPTAWKDNITGQAGGHFYQFLQVAWTWHPNSVLPWVETPSASTVHRWLTSHKSETRPDF